MNKEAIDKTIALIERQPDEKVCMRSFLRVALDAPDLFKGTGECLTSACLGGWVVVANRGHEICRVIATDAVRMKRHNENSGKVEDVPTLAASIMGLHTADADDLFYMHQVGYSQIDAALIQQKRSPTYTSVLDGFDKLPAEFRKRAAINVLTLLRDTGEVDWPVALRLTMRLQVEVLHDRYAP